MKQLLTNSDKLTSVIFVQISIVSQYIRLQANNHPAIDDGCKHLMYEWCI